MITYLILRIGTRVTSNLLLFAVNLIHAHCPSRARNPAGPGSPYTCGQDSAGPVHRAAEERGGPLLRLPAAVPRTQARPSPGSWAARSPVTDALTPGAQPRLPRRPKDSDTLSLSGPGGRTAGGGAGFTHAQSERRSPIPEGPRGRRVTLKTTLPVSPCVRRKYYNFFCFFDRLGGTFGAQSFPKFPEVVSMTTNCEAWFLVRSWLEKKHLKQTLTIGET